jgi:phosphoribosylformylglycinamidine cyclo-ligase
MKAGSANCKVAGITGHGLLKLMRPAQSPSYRIAALRRSLRPFAFLVDKAGLDVHAAYSTFNMGFGYAVCCAAGGGRAVVDLARRLGLDAIVAGSVEPGPCQVILEPVGGITPVRSSNCRPTCTHLVEPVCRYS